MNKQVLFLLCLLLYRNSRENFGVFGELGEDASENTSWQTKSQINNAGAVAAKQAEAATSAAAVAAAEARAADERRRQECNNKKTEYQTQINNLKQSIRKYDEADKNELDSPNLCSSYSGVSQNCLDKYRDEKNRAKSELCSAEEIVKGTYNYLQSTCGGGVQHYNDKLNAQEQVTMARITC